MQLNAACRFTESKGRAMEQKLNIKQRLIVVFIDIIVLMELAACLGWAHQFQDLMTPIFLKTYLPLVAVTLIVGKICIHKARSKENHF